jgi:hypothetical protein
MSDFMLYGHVFMETREVLGHHIHAALITTVGALL